MEGILKPLSSKIPSYNLFAFDIETTGKHNDFLMGSIVGDGNYKKVFWNREEMLDCIFNERRFYYHSRIFSTNLYFDSTALFKGTEYMKRLNILRRGTKFLQVKVKSDVNKRSMTFFDSLNYCLLSVDELGKIVGLPKLETPDYIKESRLPRDDEKEYIEKYNVRDSEITYNFAKFLQSSFNRFGCKMRITAASTAMDLFKRKYLKEYLFQEPITRMSLAFNAYYGGRVEVFKRGLVRNCNYYDFNSLYPSVMRNEYPNVSKSKYKKEGTLDIIECYHGISEVMMEAPEGIRIPLLPYRHDDKLLFPSGIIKGFYTNIEIRKALEIGYRLKWIGQQIYYTRSHYPFKEYVENLYSERKLRKEKGDKSELIIKLMMNSLYGKFGQKIHGKERMFPTDSLTVDKIRKYSEMGDFKIEGDFAFLVEQNPSHVASHILPIYAIYTTAYGRLKLFEAIKGIDVAYVDTDSIITPEVLPQSAELGDLKLECQIKEGIFVRPKMYGYITAEGKSKVKVKGNPEAYGWNYDQFKAFLSAPKVRYSRFSTFKTSNKKGIPFNTILDMEKEFSLNDDKREWMSEFNMNESQSSLPIQIRA